MSTVQTEKPRKVRKKLPLWAAIALSLALIGPTLAMSGNGQYLAGTVGAEIPLVFLIGFVGVALVGYGFVRLTSHMNHAGSAYGLVGGALGPRAGFFAGWAMLGAYVGYAIGCITLSAAFFNSLLAALQHGSEHPFQVPWILIVIGELAISAVLSGRNAHSITKLLLIIEVVGIIAMIVLAVVILGKGGAPKTGLDLSTFSFSPHVAPSLVLSGVVVAFLAWGGFEACASLGEETADPKRNIPRALIGALALTGVLFVFMMFVQTVGFGTDEAGLKAFSASANSLGDLAQTYVGSWFGVIVIFTATVAAFGSHLATSATSGRLLFAFARNGIGPKFLGRVNEESGSPQNALWVVLGVCLVANAASYITGWPAGVSGSGSANDTYLLFAVAGSVGLMVAYLMVEFAAAYFIAAKRFQHIHRNRQRILGIMLPIIGAVVIITVLWFNVKDSAGWNTPPLLGLYWCLVGLIVAVFTKVASRVGGSLSEELHLSDSGANSE